MQKISTHLWFDKEAREAAKFYVSVFGDGEIHNVSELHDTPSGDVDIVNFRILDHEFMSISAGPLFKFNPSISFLVACKTKEEVRELHKKLSPGGFALMELGEYPFSELYCWIADKYGLTWQIMLMGERPITQRITPTLMFVGDVAGRAEEAMKFYTSVFESGSIETKGIMRWEEGEGPDKPGTIKHATFKLNGYQFAAMDSAYEHKFAFNEAISIVVHCETQEEIDHYWKKLSAVPEAEQCGWLKDKFGVSWQIVPNAMDRMMSKADPAAMQRVTEAFLKMKKFDIAELERAYEGK